MYQDLLCTKSPGKYCGSKVDLARSPVVSGYLTTPGGMFYELTLDFGLGATSPRRQRGDHGEDE